MHTVKTFLPCLFFFLAFTVLDAQTPIQAFPFDDLSDFQDWDNPGDGWRWADDGTVEDFDPILWDGRPPIRSDSEGGAAAIAGQTGVLISPEIDLTGESQVFLRFNQYYRALNGTTVVRIDNLSDDEQAFFTVNDNVLPQVETGPRDEIVIDITTIAAGANIQIVFFFEATQYFWILDDVELYSEFPFPETQPAHYRDTFPSLGYPYNTDDEGWPYLPNEIVVQIEPGTPESEVQALRDTLGATLLDSCVCNTLQLWGLGDSVIYNQDGMLYPAGPSTDILERTKGATSSVIIQEADPNYYTVADLQQEMITNNPTLTSADLAGLTDAPDDAVRIAILDTGLDYLHPNLRPYLFKKNDTIGDGVDDDNNCAVDDPIGWDFVSDIDISNNPFDDHSHGTHVAGIVARTIEQACPENCRFQIIPYKTHDAQGVSSLFQVACATYQAIKDSVSVINDSWGFYGSGSGILENAIDSAALNDILVVTSAGNDTLSLDNQLQYPACYNTPNRLTVGAVAVDTINDFCFLAPFSNYSNTWVDILAPGVDIESTVPGGGLDEKSGTSMSAPAVSAAAAIVYCKLGDGATAENVKSLVFSTAEALGTLASEAVDGRKLDIPTLCLTSSEETAVPGRISVYPNPANGLFRLELPYLATSAVLEVFNLSGQLVRKQVVGSMSGGQTLEVDMTDLRTGMYFLRLSQAGQYWVGRVVKQ